MAIIATLYDLVEAIPAECEDSEQVLGIVLDLIAGQFLDRLKTELQGFGENRCAQNLNIVFDCLTHQILTLGIALRRPGN